MKIKINIQSITKDFIMAFIIMPYTTPVILNEYFSLGTFINYWKVLSLFMAFVYLSIKKTKPTKSVLYMLLIIVYMLFVCSTSKDATVQVWFAQAISLFFLPILFDVSDQQNFYRLTKVLFCILFVETIINFFSQIVYIDGIYVSARRSPAFVLGIENRFIFTYFACIVLGFVLKHINLWYRFLLNIELLISTISIIKAWSLGALAGLLLIWVVLIFEKPLEHIMNEITVNIAWILPDLGLLIYGFQERFSSFGSVINKNITTISGRTPLWEKTTMLILKKPLFGYGWMTNELANQYINGFNHPHNELLYLVFQGGIIGLLLNIGFFIMCLNNAGKKKETSLYYELCGMYLALMVILWIDSWTSTSYFYLIFVIISKNKMINSITNMQNSLERSM